MDLSDFSEEESVVPDAPASLPTVAESIDPTMNEMGSYDTKNGPVTFYGKEGKPLAETEDWKLFVVKLAEPAGQLGLLMISSKTGVNEAVDWQGSILSLLTELSDTLDAKAGSVEFAPRYGAFFPRLIETIDADGRTALIFGYHPIISSYRELKPVSLIPSDKRLDLKTVMWVLGKSLKLATMLHPAEFTIGKVTADNLFITQDNLDVHGVFYLDFTYAIDGASDVDFKEELSEMAKTAWFAAGGTDSSEPPLDEDIMTAEQHAEFVANLKRMMDGDVVDAQTEMDRLYEINDRIWPKIPIEGGPNSRGQTHKRQWHVFNLRNR